MTTSEITIQAIPGIRPTRVDHCQLKNAEYEPVIKAICEVFSTPEFTVKERDLYGNHRKRELSYARQMLGWIFFHEEGMTSSEAGIRIGYKDHATILYYKEQIFKHYKYRDSRAKIEAVLEVYDEHFEPVLRDNEGNKIWDYDTAGEKFYLRGKNRTILTSKTLWKHQ